MLEHDHDQLMVRLHMIGHARIETVGQYQSCMLSKLPMICKQAKHVAKQAEMESVLIQADELDENIRTSLLVITQLKHDMLERREGIHFPLRASICM